MCFILDIRLHIKSFFCSKNAKFSEQTVKPMDFLKKFILLQKIRKRPQFFHNPLAFFMKACYNNSV